MGFYVSRHIISYGIGCATGEEDVGGTGTVYLTLPDAKSTTYIFGLVLPIKTNRLRPFGVIAMPP